MAGDKGDSIGVEESSILTVYYQENILMIYLKRNLIEK